MEATPQRFIKAAGLAIECAHRQPIQVYVRFRLLPSLRTRPDRDRVSEGLSDLGFCVPFPAVLSSCLVGGRSGVVFRAIVFFQS